ncbi:MAG: hypothetical protein R3B81_11550 [bacterium]
MKTILMMVAAAIVLVFLAVAAAPVRGDTSTAPAEELTFTLELGSRLYPEWSETVEVRLDERFYLGDTEYQAAAREFLPDFRINDGVPASISEDWNNPAVHVFVYTDTAAVDSSWAFRNFPPHFGPQSFFTFRLTDIQPERTPASASTSAATSVPAPEEAPE